MAAQVAGSEEIEVPHLVAGLLGNPESVAVKAIHRLGSSEEQVRQALGIASPPDAGDSDPAALRRLRFSRQAKTALRLALKTALRLGHNYIGTEHLLLGALAADEASADRLAAIGIQEDLVERAINIELAQFQLEKLQRS